MFDTCLNIDETLLSFPIFALLLKVGGLDLPILDMRENGSGRSAFISVAIIPFPVLDLRHALFAYNLIYTG